MIELKLDVEANLPELGLAPATLARLHDIAANGVIELVQENFRMRGGRRYWREARDHVTATANEREAIVTIAWPGVRLHLLGGIVLPGKGISSKTGAATKLLAIPADGVDMAPRSYKAPLAYVGVKGRPRLKGLLIPGQKRQARRKYKDKPAGREIIVPQAGAPAAYHLVTQTVHQPDPSVLPPMEQMQEQAAAGMARGLRMMRPKR